MTLSAAQDARTLRIFLGAAEAASISQGLAKSATDRPMTMDFAYTPLGAAGASLEEVRIEALRSDKFYAIARLRAANQTREVDARPSTRSRWL